MLVCNVLKPQAHLEEGRDAIMFWILTLLSKARVAPDLLKVWNPCPFGDIFLWSSTLFNASRM